jgi:hypothetical protein
MATLAGGKGAESKVDAETSTVCTPLKWWVWIGDADNDVGMITIDGML